MNKGFSLLEIILTIIILAVGILALFRTFNVLMPVDNNMRKTTIALSLAQEKMEEVKSAGSYAVIDSYAQARTGLGGDFADFEREVSVSGDPKEVTVRLYWGPSGGQESLELVTLMADYDY